MVHGHAVFIREEAKLATNTHLYSNMKLHFFQLPEHKPNYTAGCTKWTTRVIMT